MVGFDILLRFFLDTKIGRGQELAHIRAGLFTNVMRVYLNAPSSIVSVMIRLMIKIRCIIHWVDLFVYTWCSIDKATILSSDIMWHHTISKHASWLLFIITATRSLNLILLLSNDISVWIYWGLFRNQHITKEFLRNDPIGDHLFVKVWCCSRHRRYFWNLALLVQLFLFLA